MFALLQELLIKINTERERLYEYIFYMLAKLYIRLILLL